MWPVAASFPWPCGMHSERQMLAGASFPNASCPVLRCGDDTKEAGHLCAPGQWRRWHCVWDQCRVGVRQVGAKVCHRTAWLCMPWIL